MLPNTLVNSICKDRVLWDLCMTLAKFQGYFPTETKVLVQAKYNPLCLYLTAVFICNI